MDRVEHNGRTTAYRASGKGVPVVFVHGSGGTHAVWNHQLRDADGFRAVALDLSGHGESDDVVAEPGPATLAAYAEDVIAVGRATDARAVVGSSLGGAVALVATLDAGFRPDALVLAGAGAAFALHPDLLRWLDEDYEAAITFFHEPGRLFADPDPATVERSKTAMRSAGQRVTRRDVCSVAEFDVRDRLDELSTPVFALTGEDDTLTPPAHHRYVAERVPDGRWTTVPDAAHLSMLERPSAFTERVTRFLATAL